MTDLNRLGKRGSYRLGQLRVQGTGPADPPALLRPRFRPRHRGPMSLWLLAAAAGTAVIAGGAAAGLWFAPFAVGLAAGLVSRAGGWRPRVLALAVTVLASAGWGIALGWPALHGQRAGGSAPVIAVLAAWPGPAAGGVLVTLAVAVLQAVAGLGLGRVLTRPRPPIPDLAALTAGMTEAGTLAAGTLAAATPGAGTPGAGTPDAGTVAAAIAAAEIAAAEITAGGAAGTPAAAATAGAGAPPAGAPAGGATDPQAGDLDGGSGRQPGPAGPTMGG
jgi:hypothetical protein